MNLPEFLGPYQDIPRPVADRFAASIGVDVKTLGFTMQHQLANNWCWAATGASVSAFYGRPPILSQDEVASQILSCNCSGHPTPAICDQQHQLDDVLSLTGALTLPLVNGPLSFDDVVEEIDAGHLVCCHISWGNGYGHFNAICGYDQGKHDLKIADPFYDDQTVPFGTFVSDYQQSGSWDFSYRTM